jgi:hypothetical protein
VEVQGQEPVLFVQRRRTVNSAIRRFESKKRTDTASSGSRRSQNSRKEEKNRTVAYRCLCSSQESSELSSPLL